MERMKPPLCDYGSHLGDRILWYDGSMTIDPSTIMSFLTPGVKLHTTELTSDIRDYNKLADNPITIKTDLDLDALVDTQMNIPDEYRTINVRDYVCLKLNKWTGRDLIIRQQRVESELELYDAVDKIDVLRLMIYVVETFRKNKKVWGVGRGSSVSSFVLFLIGVHDIDSVKYALNFNDFIQAPK